MLRAGLLGTCLLLVAFTVQAQPEFPPLQGRVSDHAELLDAATEARLTQALEAHERATGEQVVVATLPDLQGYPIEQYGYQLGRHWGIGREGQDDGALLIVAPNERAVRIEVGYGLEGRLTDAQSALIIHEVITPAFARGDFAEGISRGVEAMLVVLGGQPLAAQQPQRRPAQAQDEPPPLGFIILFFIIMALLRGAGGRRRRRGVVGGILLGHAMGQRGRGGFGGGGFGGGGGFSGGGGGFGGGGASGSW